MSALNLTRRSFLRASSAGLAATALAACQPQIVELEKVVKETVLVEATQPAVQAAAQAPVTIGFMGWGGPEESQGVIDLITMFEHEHPDIKVTWLHTPRDYMPKLLANIAAGTPPDTLFCWKEVYKKWARDGMLLDITDYMQADPMLGQPDYFLQPQERDRVLWQGRQYGIGACFVGPHLYYNPDRFTEAGIEPPSNDPEESWPFDQFVETARQLTHDGKGRHPGESGFDANDVQQWGLMGGQHGEHLYSFVLSNGGVWIDEATNSYQLDQPASTDVIQKLANLTLVDKIVPEASTLKDLGMSNTQMLETGRLAMAVDGTYALAWVRKINAPLGTAAMPKFIRPVTIIQSDIRCGMSATKHPEACWQWLRALAGPWYQSIFLKMGLWWPSQTSLMTAEGMKTWITERKSPTEGVHPAGYEVLVDKFVRNYGVSPYVPPGILESEAVIRAALDSVRNGNRTAVEAMAEAVPEATAVLQSEAAAS